MRSKIKLHNDLYPIQVLYFTVVNIIGDLLVQLKIMIIFTIFYNLEAI